VSLIVHEGEGEYEVNLKQSFQSNPVSQPEFGEYVASLHSCNNSTFILQYEVPFAIIVLQYKFPHITEMLIIVVGVRRRGEGN
jgi:hypothetical protein